MRKWLKRVIIGAVSLCLLAAAGAAGIYAFVIERPTVNIAFPAMEPYKWNRVDLGKEALSSDGSDYYLLTRRGESANWIVFFSGGGAAWDAESAGEPIRVMNILRGRDAGNYFANLPFYLLTLLDGMLASGREDNPFRTWNVAYIPYSTGDFHIGDREARYERDKGGNFTMRYNGRTNVTAALDWVYEHARDPEKLLIAGESAGGFGSAFWAGEIASQYQDAEIYQYSDSAFLYSERWPEIVSEEWQASPEERLGFRPEADLIGSATRSNGHKLPEGTVILQTYSLYDEVLISFQNKLNADTQLQPEEWSRQLRNAIAEMDRSIPNYYYYLTDDNRNSESGTTPHTYATRNQLYSVEQDGVRLLTWLDDMINGRERYSVGSGFLELDR